MNNWISRAIESKKRYKEYKRQKQDLPMVYREGLDALEKYMWNFAGGDNFMLVLENILELFQDGARNKSSVTEIIGEDPAQFADNIMAEYPEELWFENARKKLNEKIEKIEE